MKLDEIATEAAKLTEEERAALASRLLHRQKAPFPAKTLLHEPPAGIKFPAVSLSSDVARVEACPRSSEESSRRKGGSLA